MANLRDVQFEAFYNELEKCGAPWLRNAGQAVVNYGKRQLHGLTGYTPHGFMNTESGKGLKWLEDIGAGAGPAREHYAKATGAAKDLAEKSLKANEAAQGMGLTSIPGYARSLWNDPRKTLRTGFDQQWHGTTAKQKALLVGLPLASTALSAAAPEDPENPRKVRNVTAGTLGAAVGAVTGSIPVTTGIALGEGVERIGGALGGLVDRQRRRPPTGRVLPPPSPELEAGGPVSHERVLSPRLSGQVEGV